VFGLVWFYLFLAPSSSLLPNGIYEHRLYGPLFGILVAVFIPLGVEIIDQPARYRRALASIALSLAAFLIICFCFLTYIRNQVWRDDLTLWEDAVKKSPGSWRAQSNYGNQLMEQNKYFEAYPYIERGYALNSNIVGTAVNLGVCRYYIGDVDGSIEVLEYALGLQSNVEDLRGLVVEYLCVIYLDKAKKCIAAHNYETALSCINRVLTLQPENPEAEKLNAAITVKGKNQ
jgi:tetratricopeptide (TPR) repeat protein